MLINIANLDTEYEDKQVHVAYSDMATMDKNICYVLSRLLFEMSDYVSDSPSDYTSLQDWQWALKEHAGALGAYSSINDIENELDEVYIIADAKQAMVFISEYLEDLWVNNEPDI
jgi:hypothetical protein